MNTRKGRLNEVSVSTDVVYKIAVVKESRRPSRLKVESWALSVARECGANVPKVIDYFVNQYGQEVLVIEKIPRCVRLSRCLPQRRAMHMLDVGRQLALLNHYAVSGYGWIDSTTLKGCYETWKSFLLSYVDTFGSRLVAAEIVDSTYVAKIFATIKNTDLSLTSSCLIHRDLKSTNLLVDEKGKVWIVDWENVILGDPLYDLAIVGTREGRNFVWQNLIVGRALEVDSPRYQLYETLALFGFLDFGRRYGQSYKGLCKRLSKILSAL